MTCPACPPPGGGGGCFAAGTGVTMADGSVKPIEDVATAESHNHIKPVPAGGHGRRWFNRFISGGRH